MFRASSANEQRAELWGTSGVRSIYQSGASPSPSQHTPQRWQPQPRHDAVDKPAGLCEHGEEGAHICLAWCAGRGRARPVPVWPARGTRCARINNV